MKQNGYINSRQHVALYDDGLGYKVKSGDSVGRMTVYATLVFQNPGEHIEFVVSGPAERMETLPALLHRFADEIELECERVIGREQEQLDREMEQAERDMIDQHRDAAREGY